MKKRILTVFLVLTAFIALVSLLTVGVCAETSGNYEYSIVTDGAEITSYLGNEENVSIPTTLGGESVVSIAAKAFSECTSIKTLTIPSSVTSIGAGAFRYCTSLESAVINANVTSLADQIFSCCTSLESVTLPSGLTSIGFRSFYGCKSLASFTVPASVTSIGNEAFSDCDSLVSINVASGNTAFKSSDGILFSADGKTLVCFPSGIKGDYTVPSTVKTIGKYAFRSATGVTSVTIPSGVTSIGDGAFLSASSLSYVIVPASVTSVGYNAFSSCKKLNTAYVEKSTIAEKYFEDNCENVVLVYLDDVSFGDYEITSEIKTVAGANKVEVKTSLTKNEGFAGLTFTMNFDTSKLCIESVSKGSSFESTLNTDEPDIVLSSLDNVKFYYVNASEVTATGELFTLTFSIADEFTTEDISLDVTSFYNEDIANILPLISFDDVTVPGSFPITFNACGGTFGSAGTKVSDALDTFPTATKDGSVFDGWYTAAEGGTEIKSGDSIDTETVSTLYAHWASNGHTVSFDACGGETVSETKIVSVGGTYGTLPTTSRTGYDFDGWYTAAEGGSKIEATTTVTITADQTLYAHFTAKTFNVSFSTSGSTASGITVTYDSTYGTLPTTSRTGYDFDGWYTAAEGGSKIEATTTVTITADQTLYAHFTAKTFNVSFSTSGSTASGITVTYDSTYGTLPTTSRTGYDFDGWYTAAEGGSKIEATTKVTITADQTLYAHFTAKTYTVTFNACGGTSDRSSLTATYNLPYGILPTATKTDYIFAGWFTAENGGSEVKSDTVFTSDSNVTLYAHWSSNAGDLNNDGKVDINDSVMLSQYLAKWDIEINLANADCNGDGLVDIRDAVRLAQFLAGWDVSLC